MKRIVKWSESFIYTLREAPADAEIPSHQLLVRAGYIRKVAPGIYTYGQLGLRALRKFEEIIREELDNRGCVEILMPMVQPDSLWKETGRWEIPELLKFKNRNGHDFCLGATHEEVVTDYIRKDIKSYRDLPKVLYQIQDKYRDEIRPRFGLMRGREFFMKDAYSFDPTEEAALKSYDVLYQAYHAIFDRLGLKYRVVEADAGNIGGSKTHEFQVLADAGEDLLTVCSQCDFAANIEITPVKGRQYPPTPEEWNTKADHKIEEFPTPGLRTINELAKSLKAEPSHLVKTLFFALPHSDQATSLKAVAVLLRGDDELNLLKLQRFLRLSEAPRMLTDEEVRQVTGASPGSCGPVGLKIPVYMDESVQDLPYFTVGANKDDFHIRFVQIGRDFTPAGVGEFKLAREGDPCPNCAGTLQTIRGIEVGHVFFLGTKYSEAMKATFLDADGKERPVQMGCYGIGIGRTVQAAVEQNHDKDGIIWTPALAPFHVHICHLDPQDAKAKAACQSIADQLAHNGVEVFIDDREERPGVKFKDADLLGFPLRVVIGQKGLSNNIVELKVRSTGESSNHAPEALPGVILEWMRNYGRN